MSTWLLFSSCSWGHQDADYTRVSLLNRCVMNQQTSTKTMCEKDTIKHTLILQLGLESKALKVCSVNCAVRIKNTLDWVELKLITPLKIYNFSNIVWPLHLNSFHFSVKINWQQIGPKHTSCFNENHIFFSSLYSNNWLHCCWNTHQCVLIVSFKTLSNICVFFRE